jgi:hypothetical protein
MYWCATANPTRYLRNSENIAIAAGSVRLALFIFGVAGYTDMRSVGDGLRIVEPMRTV